MTAAVKNISCTVQLRSLREGVFFQAEISNAAGSLCMILSLWSQGQRKGCSHLSVIVAWFKPVSETAETSCLIEIHFPARWLLSKVINGCELDSEQLVDGEWYQGTGHTVVTVTPAAPAHVLWHLLGNNLPAREHKVGLSYPIVLTFKKWHLVFYFLCPCAFLPCLQVPQLPAQCPLSQLSCRMGWLLLKCFSVSALHCRTSDKFSMIQNFSLLKRKLESKFPLLSWCLEFWFLLNLGNL